MVTVIAEISGNSLHPVTAQLVGAAGGNATVLCPGGIGAAEAAAIAGVAKVISVEGDCFTSFDGGAWASALGSQCEGRVLTAATPNGREIAARMGSAMGPQLAVASRRRIITASPGPTQGRLSTAITSLQRLHTATMSMDGGIAASLAQLLRLW